MRRLNIKKLFKLSLYNINGYIDITNGNNTSSKIGMRQYDVELKAVCVYLINK